MPRIPPELYIAILAALKADPWFDWRGDLSPKAALETLALTSRSLRAIAQPLLFESIEISSTKDWVILSRVLKLKNLFDERPEITEWVKEFGLGRHPPGTGSIAVNTSTLRELWPTLSNIFVRMDKLHTVRFGWADISSATHEHLYRLPDLRSLTLDSVTIQPLADSKNLSVEELRLKELQIRGYRQQVPAAATQFARAPGLDYLALPYLDPATSQSLLGLIASHVFKTLSSLSLTEVPSFEHLIVFAARCPNLRSLHFLYAPIALELPTGVPNDTFSFLTRYYGPLNIAQLLVPGRPLETIDVSTYIPDPREWSRGDLEPLAGGSENVRELTLGTFSWHRGFMDDLRDLFPHAEVLKLTFHKPDKASR